MSFFSAFLLSLPSSLWAFFVKRFPVRTVEEDTFRFDPATGLIHYTRRNHPEPYVLVVDGLVKKKMAFSYGDLKALPQVGQTSDFHCVEGWSVRDVQWEGIRLGEIVKKAGPKPEARYAVFHALGTTSSRPDGLDHYVESLPLSTLLDGKKECLLALGMDGRPLTDAHGAPLRLVSPYDLGYKSIKYVTRIQFTREQQPGWWTLANPIYAVDAPVPPLRLRKK
jgi:DMSO/TMAO reductase YedYZ molybdopterin-dependent catalytic subunit